MGKKKKRKKRSFKEEKCGKRKGGWIKRIWGRKEGGRKAPCVSKNEAKYKVNEIKLKQEIVTPPV